MLHPTGAPALAPRLPLVASLADHGERSALVTPETTLTYADLAARVEEVAPRLGTGRRLVLLAAANDLDTVVHYLAALHAGHVVLLAPRANATAVEALVAGYDPDVVVGVGEQVLQERREGSVHDLHPDLALLLSTSGSTGSPKLVRLSWENLQANAASIAEYLGIRDTDRAATTLPLQYCYGLSVLHSHLLRGAAVVLTDLSVVDACFWDLFRREQCTTFAGVPYTFDLLDRIGFASMDLPHLRYITQAGGRLDPERVRRYAVLGRARGWDLVVMYGQTEATARMAYLPPDLAIDRPSAIGVPVPGGTFHVEPVAESDDPAVGELVYSGPNVMLGYARTPTDLALGREIDVLRTGDLARQADDGLYEVVGRRSRFLKLFGLRVDLARVETLLAADGHTACATGDDDRLVVALVDPEAAESTPVEAVGARLAQVLGLPTASVVVVAVTELPRLENGKPDLRAVRDLAPTTARTPAAASVPAETGGGVTPEALRALYAELLRRDATLEDSFVDLGGDSLSYVEMSVRLEQVLGHLPDGWHTRSIAELAALAPPRRRLPGARVETSIALRAVAIVLVVATHSHLISVTGGAHLLMGVAGYNFARFQLAVSDRVQRLRSVVGALGRLVVPSAVWIAGAALLTDKYRWANVLMVNNLVGPDRWGTAWHFWFLEAVVYIVLGVTALLTIPLVDRVERRFPFAVAGALLTVGLLFRYEVLTGPDGPRLGLPHMVFWFFMLGWAAAKARTVWHRAAVTAVAVLSIPGFFDNPSRDTVVLAGVCLLVWIGSIPLPAVLARLAGVLAGASLSVYVTHWVVYPLVKPTSELLAVLVSFAVGIAWWRLTTWAMGRSLALLRR